jgi:hypothetical protein
LASVQKQKMIHLMGSKTKDDSFASAQKTKDDQFSSTQKTKKYDFVLVQKQKIMNLPQFKNKR